MSPKTRATRSPQLTESEIAQRAYQHWLARGRPTGDGREDWFTAEAELAAERAPQREPVAPPKKPRKTIRSALRRLGI